MERKLCQPYTLEVNHVIQKYNLQNLGRRLGSSFFIIFLCFLGEFIGLWISGLIYNLWTLATKKIEGLRIQ